MLDKEWMKAIVGELRRGTFNERKVNEDEGGLVLFKLGFEPVQLLFSQRP